MSGQQKNNRIMKHVLFCAKHKTYFLTAMDGSVTDAVFWLVILGMLFASRHTIQASISTAFGWSGTFVGRAFYGLLLVSFTLYLAETISDFFSQEVVSFYKALGFSPKELFSLRLLRGFVPAVLSGIYFTLFAWDFAFEIRAFGRATALCVLLCAGILLLSSLLSCLVFALRSKQTRRGGLYRLNNRVFLRNAYLAWLYKDMKDAADHIDVWIDGAISIALLAFSVFYGKKLDKPLLFVVFFFLSGLSVAAVADFYFLETKNVLLLQTLRQKKRDVFRHKIFNAIILSLLYSLLCVLANVLCGNLRIAEAAWLLLFLCIQNVTACICMNIVFARRFPAVTRTSGFALPYFLICLLPLAPLLYDLAVLIKGHGSLLGTGRSISMLEVTALEKSYEKKRGISDITFSLKEGTIAAVVGPNGAGKSTLFNILAGLLATDSGRCILGGVDLKMLPSDQLSFMPEHSYLIPHFTPRQMLLYINQMKTLGLSSDEIDKHLDDYGIASFADKPDKSLSQGMEKRVCIAAALMKKPRLIILDEPTNGLDIQSTIYLKQTLLKKREAGAIILVSGHVLDFLSTICDAVLFMDEGELVSSIYGHENDIEAKYIELFMRGE